MIWRDQLGHPSPTEGRRAAGRFGRFGKELLEMGFRFCVDVGSSPSRKQPGLPERLCCCVRNQQAAFRQGGDRLQPAARRRLPSVHFCTSVAWPFQPFLPVLSSSSCVESATAVSVQFPGTSAGEQLPTCVSSVLRCLFTLLAISDLGVCFLIVRVLCVFLDASSLSSVWLADIFIWSVACLRIL